jgi:hypothetical protein
MKELFSFLWTSAPEVMSMMGIIGMLTYIAVKITLFYTRIEGMQRDIAEMRKDINKIMEYLVTGKVEVLVKK